MMQELDKYIISDKESQLWGKVLTFLDSYKSLSPIQVNNFILNDVEFPTDYAKYKQAQFELIARWGRFVDAKLEIKELETKIRLKEREIDNEDDELKKELLQIEKEKLIFQLLGKQRELKTINEEARLFWEVYEKGEKKFSNCSKEQIEELEREYWMAKTMNMPTVFEERYGDEYMRKILGEEIYSQYLEVRQKLLGLLPRELIKGGAKCLKSDTKKQLEK